MCIAQALSHVCRDKRGIVCPTSSSLFHAGQAASAVGWGLKKNKQPAVSLEWLSLANGLLSNRACSLGLAKISALQNCLLALVITANLRRYDLMVVWLLNALHILKTTRLPHGIIEETSRMVSTLAVFLRRTTGDSSTVTITAAKLSYSLLLHSPHVGHDLDKEMHYAMQYCAMYGSVQDFTSLFWRISKHLSQAERSRESGETVFFLFLSLLQRFLRQRPAGHVKKCCAIYARLFCVVLDFSMDQEAMAFLLDKVMVSRHRIPVICKEIEYLSPMCLRSKKPFIAKRLRELSQFLLEINKSEATVRHGQQLQGTS